MKKIILGFLIISILFKFCVWGNATGTLIVNLHPFNYSDGVNSEEHIEFVRRQGGELGQPHVTFEVAGPAQYRLVIIPATLQAVKKLKSKIEEQIKLHRILTEQFGMAYHNPYVEVIRPICDFPLDFLRDTNHLMAVISLEPQTYVFTNFPSGRYFILPIVRFSGEGDFSSYYYWSALFHQSYVEISYEGRIFTYTPVVWSPNEITVNSGDTTMISISPHAYNLSLESGVIRFFKDVVFKKFGIKFPEE